MAHACLYDRFETFTNWRWRLVALVEGLGSLPDGVRPSLWAMGQILTPPREGSRLHQIHPDLRPWPEALSDNRRVISGTEATPRPWSRWGAWWAASAIYPDTFPRLDGDWQEVAARFARLNRWQPADLVAALRIEQTGDLVASPTDYKAELEASLGALLARHRAMQAEADTLEPLAEAWDLANR